MLVSFTLLGEKIALLIVASNEDPASINIRSCLLEKAIWNEIDKFQGNSVFQLSNLKDVIIVTINDEKIFRENVDKEVENELGIKAKQLIFISRHTSKTGEPTLTVHPIGNYGRAEYGGKDRTLVKSSPKLMTELLRILKSKAREEELYHKVCFEVTHHGPYVDVPTLYIEIGSNEKEWIKKQPANVVASAILETLKKYCYEEEAPKDIPVLIGIGGGHYAPRFTDIALEKKVAFGHMIPNYQIDSGNIDEEMLTEAIDKTPNLSGVYLHKKTLRKSLLTEYKNWFTSEGIKVFSSKDLEDLNCMSSS